MLLVPSSKIRVAEAMKIEEEKKRNIIQQNKTCIMSSQEDIMK